MKRNIRPDIENWGLGTFLYAYVLYWVLMCLLINTIFYLSNEKASHRLARGSNKALHNL